MRDPEVHALHVNCWNAGVFRWSRGSQLYLCCRCRADMFLWMQRRSLYDGIRLASVWIQKVGDLDAGRVHTDAAVATVGAAKDRAANTSFPCTRTLTIGGCSRRGAKLQYEISTAEASPVSIMAACNLSLRRDWHRKPTGRLTRPTGLFRRA